MNNIQNNQQCKITVQYSMCLHKIGVWRTLPQLWYFYNIVGRGQLCFRRLEKLSFQKLRISRQNLRKMKENFYGKYFQEGEVISKLTKNNGIKVFGYVYLKTLVVKVYSKKWNTSGTKKKLSGGMYMNYEKGTIQYLTSIWFM